MTVVRPPGPRIVSTSSSSNTSTPMPANEKASLTTVITAAALLVAFYFLGALMAALLGAVAGLVSAWLQRGFRLRSKFGLSLAESLVTSKFWEEAASTAVVQIFLGALAGVAAAGIAGWMGLPIGAYRISLVLGGGGSGGSDPANGLLIFALLIIIVCIIVYLIFNPIIARSLIEEALKGGVEAVAAKSVVSLLLHKPRDSEIDSNTRAHLRVSLLWPSAVEGAITGVLVCLILILVGLR